MAPTLGRNLTKKAFSFQIGLSNTYGTSITSQI